MRFYLFKCEGLPAVRKSLIDIGLLKFSHFQVKGGFGMKRHWDKKDEEQRP